MSQIRKAAAVLKLPPEGASEHLHQAYFVSWWRKNRSELIFAIPNGEARSKSVASRLKAEGVLSGVWDLFVPELALWIEMKRPSTGKLSDRQKHFGARMEAAGYRCIVAWGCEDAVKQVQD